VARAAKTTKRRTRATVEELEKLTKLRLELADEKQSHRDHVAKMQSDLTYLSDQLKQTRSQRDEYEKKWVAEIESHNETRDLLHKSEAAVNRLNGYLDGLEDSRSPRMVPEEKTSRREPQPLSDAYLPYETASSGYGSPKKKRWYHR
jgi:chromosome segregation ATPase